MTESFHLKIKILKKFTILHFQCKNLFENYDGKEVFANGLHDMVGLGKEACLLDIVSQMVVNLPYTYITYYPILMGMLPYLRWYLFGNGVHDMVGLGKDAGLLNVVRQVVFNLLYTST